MAGLAGILAPTANRTEISRLLTDMCALLVHKTWQTTFAYVEEPAGLARVSLNIFNPEPQPIFSDDGSKAIIMEGELYDHRRLKQRFSIPDDIGSVQNDPALILYLYRLHGLEFVRELHGSFVLAIWDKTTRQLIIINDRFGLRPLYYTVNPKHLLFASEVKALLQSPHVNRSLNYEAIGEFLTFQILLGHKTFFSNIFVLPPASVLSYHLNENKVTIDSYWDLSFQEHQANISEQLYLEQLTHLVKQAVARRMTGPYPKGIFLSGGLDSRTLLGAIEKKHYPLHTFTMGIPHSYDVKFAARIAQAKGTIHHYQEFPPDFLARFTERSVWLTDGMVSCEHTGILSLLDLTRRHCQVVYDALGAGVFLGGSYLKPELFISDMTQPEKLHKYLYHKFATAFPKNLWPIFLSEKLYNLIGDAPYQSLKIEIDKAPAEHPANKSEYVHIKTRQRRFIFFGPHNTRSQMESRTPFYDNDLIEYVYSIPPELKLNKRIYLKLIQHAFPDLARIPWSFSGLPITVTSPRRLFVQRARYKLHRMLRTELYRFSAGRLLIPYPREFTNYPFWLRTDLRNWVEDILLSQQTLDRNYFYPDQIRRLLDEHMSGQRNHTARICTLITFESWHRQFVD